MYYTGWLVTSGTSGKGVILREKRSRKYRIKIFRLRLCFRENRLWIFARYACTLSRLVITDLTLGRCLDWRYVDKHFQCDWSVFLPILTYYSTFITIHYQYLLIYHQIYIQQSGIYGHDTFGNDPRCRLVITHVNAWNYEEEASCQCGSWVTLFMESTSLWAKQMFAFPIWWLPAFSVICKNVQ